jgi:hypothetical protein
MRLIVHDYSGHAFPIDLSRELARRGHTVLHLYADALQTPRGQLQPLPGDPPAFAIEAVSAGSPIEKYAMVRRWRQEGSYGRQLAARIAAFRPDAVLSGNTPLRAQAAAIRASHAAGARFAFWVQDLLGIGYERALRRKLPGAGALIGRHFQRFEAALLRQSDGVVAICEEFAGIARALGVQPSRLEVIENWAPLDDLRPGPRDNSWSRAHGLNGRTCFLYAGTLGLKHNPALLAGLAESLAPHADVAVVVISEGLGADWLAREKSRRQLHNLTLLPYQLFDQLEA